MNFKFFLGNYFGIDWLAMFFTFSQLYFLGNKKRFAFLLGAGANIAFMTFGFMANSSAQVIANFIFLAMNLRAYFLWKKDTSKRAD